MRTRPVIPLLIILVLVVVTTSPASHADTPEGLAPDVDSFVESYLDRHGLPGATVALVKDGESVYEQGYGVDSEDQPLTPTSRMRLASVSKSFTALAVLQLVDQGVVDLDEPVVTYLPDLSAGDDHRIREVTVGQLLSHTSGLTSPTILPPAETVPEGAARSHQWPLDTDPGTSYRYSNLNYWIAAWLVQEVSAMPFEDYLERNVFTPLRMADTRATTKASTSIDALARGHVTAYGTAFAAPEAEQMFAGAGGVSSTAADMARWLRMWQRNGVTQDETALLSPGLVEQAHTPQPNAGRAGFGWAHSSRGIAPERVSTSGVLGTFNAQQDLVPESGYGVVVLLNSYTPTREHAYEISSGIIALTEGAEPDIGSPVPTIVDLGLAALTGMTMALGVLGLRRADSWVRRRARWPLWRFTLRLVPQLIMPAVAVLLFVVGSSVQRNALTPADVFRLYPALMVLVLALAGVGLTLTTLRVVVAVRRGVGEEPVDVRRAAGGGSEPES